ncbi:MAG: DUF2127 domain-containing protein [Nitrospiraceae bacterium]|nr:DUF2127 domain-containing protein [Nitrospiraceae bacterium]
MAREKSGHKAGQSGKKLLHASFIVMLALKGVLSFFEVLGGVALFFIPPSLIGRFVRLLTEQELVEDPRDFIANHLRMWASHFSIHSEAFAAIYLLSHGAVKLLLVGSLWKRKLWAYPTGIMVFFGFIVYQLYRYSHTGSIFLVFLTGLDLLLIYLTWQEYKLVKSGAV